MIHSADIPDAEKTDELFERCYRHVMSQLEQAKVGEDPFYHLFVEEIFPSDFYASLRSHMIACKHGDDVKDRQQDSQSFLNKRTNLFDNNDPIVNCVRRLFSEPDIKRTLLT